MEVLPSNLEEMHIIQLPRILGGSFLQSCALDALDMTKFYAPGSAWCKDFEFAHYRITGYQTGYILTAATNKQVGANLDPVMTQPIKGESMKATHAPRTNSWCSQAFITEASYIGWIQ